MGQTKSGSQAHHKRRTSRTVTSPGFHRPHPGARPGLAGAAGEAPGGRVFAHGTRPAARNGDVGLPSSRLTTRRKVHEGPVCNVVWVAVVAGSLDTQSLEQNSGNRDMECHLTGGKEPELVHGRLRALERGWTLHSLELPRVSGGELVWACS
ncbi:hypothetical protein L3Q82_025639 [Scortum barcoo]|uniref:Uncharacterized protein n=1 Tax=Scortum barcoo TaxID=214431 RepID=A0ACB8WLN8_9TELE|nr:hypothetical protein L3Q82_025639 [Scortum barcoo]